MDMSETNAKRALDVNEEADVVIYTHDFEGRFSTINKAGEEATGYTLAELRSLTIFELMRPEAAEKLRHRMTPKFLGVVPIPCEIRILTRSGREITLPVSVRLGFRAGKAVVQGISQPLPKSPMPVAE